MCGVETKNNKNNRILGSANAGRMGLYPAYPASTKCVSCYFFVNPADLIAPYRQRKLVSICTIKLE
jgi:hypothetical protein